MRIIFCVAVLVLVGVAAQDDEKSVSFGTVEAKVKGQSGKITLSRSESSSSITVEFDNLKEKKSDGTAIKESSHTYNGFASQSFTFSSPSEGQYPSTEIDVIKLSFDATLTNQASLKVDLYIFKEDGTISQDGEDKEVKAGNIKFNVDISGWTFCSASTSCQQSEIGEYLDFQIVMKGSKGASKGESSSGEEFDMGSGSVWLSQKVNVDGTTGNMASGYPKLVSQGSKDIFEFRFNKFNSRVVYDPTVALYGGSAMARLSAVVALVVCVFHMLRQIL